MGESKKLKSKRSLRKYRVRLSNKHLTSSAGLSLLHRFWQQLGGEAWIDSQLGSLKAVNSVYSVGRIVTILLMAIIQGAKHVSHILQLSHDQGLRKLWDWVSFPVETTVVRTLNLFGQSQVVKIADLNQNLRQQVWNRKWLGKVTLDLDSTVKTVYGHQEGAEKGYNHVHPGKRSYHPLIAFIAETGEALLGWLRPGDTFSANGSVEFIKEALSRLPKQVWKVVIRADAAFFSHDFLCYLESLGHHYVVKVKTKRWKIWAEQNGNWRQSGHHRWTAKFKAKLPGWKHERTFIAVRIFKEYAEDDLFGKAPVYDYQLWVTDLPLSANQLELFYNQRATCENLIDVGKNQVGWCGMLTKRFWTNDLIFQLALLAYNLLVWFKMRFLPPEMQGQETETIRSWLIKTAGQVVHTGRQWFLDIGSDNPWKELWVSIGNRQLSEQPF
ncbi:MAG: IS1380 family transposase [FCB group bacterium]|nr:IS1380 family transposase [FCB group bacterium]